MKTVTAAALDHPLEETGGYRRRWLSLAVVLTATFIAVLNTFIVNVAVPSIQRDLNASFGQVSFIVTSYVLAYGVFLVTGGRLGDIYGRKVAFLAGMAGFTFTSLLCGLAPTANLLIAARVAQGITAALMYPQVLAFIQVTFTGRERATAFGILGATIGFSSIVGQIIGGLLIKYDLFGFGWRGIFLINVPLGLLALTTAFVLLPAVSSESRSRLDLGGVAIVSLGLLLLAYPLVEGREAGWPLWMFASLLLSVPVLALFARFESRKSARGESPLVEMRLFRERSFVVGFLIALFFIGGNTGLFFLLALYLQIGLGYSALDAGLTFAPLAITFTVSSFIAARLIPRLGRWVLSIGFAIVVIGTVQLILTARQFGPEISILQLAPSLGVIGFGEGFGVAPLIGLILTGIRARDAGSAAGVVSTFNQIGNAFGVATLGLIFFTALDHQTGTQPERYVEAFALTLVANVTMAAISFLLVFLLPGAPKRSTAARPSTVS